MNIEDYREYCLSLGEDIEEKLPFQKFKNGEGVLVFYVMGHMFSFFPKHWIGINPATAPDELLKELTRNSYEIVKAKYKKRKEKV